jgi:hypothetical protein
MGWCHKFLFGIHTNISLIGNICCDILQYTLLNNQEAITFCIFKNYESGSGIFFCIYKEGDTNIYTFEDYTQNICAEHLADMRYCCIPLLSIPIYQLLV